MLKGKKIKLTKVGVANSPFFSTMKWKDYQLGSSNNTGSLPIDYWLEGYLITDPVIGLSLVIDRTSRNGIDERGITRTSRLQKLKKESEYIYRLETDNSVYYMEIYDEDRNNSGSNSTNN